MSLRHVIAIAIIGGAPTFAASSEPEAAALAVAQSIRWESYWYGTPYGANCLKPSSSRGTISVFLRPELILVGYDCDSGNAIRERGKVFEATSPNTGIIFSGTVGDVTRADVSDGNETCSVTESDVRARIRMILNKGVSVDFRAAEPAPSKDPSEALVGYALRSMRAWSVRESKATPSSVRIGKFAFGDPYLLLLTDANDAVHLLAIPAPHRIREPAYCGIVYSSARFGGRDRPARLISGAEGKFKENSKLFRLN